MRSTKQSCFLARALPSREGICTTFPSRARTVCDPLLPFPRQEGGWGFGGITQSEQFRVATKS